MALIAEALTAPARTIAGRARPIFYGWRPGGAPSIGHHGRADGAAPPAGRGRSGMRSAAPRPGRCCRFLEQCSGAAAQPTGCGRRAARASQAVAAAEAAGAAARGPADAYRLRAPAARRAAAGSPGGARGQAAGAAVPPPSVPRRAAGCAQEEGRRVRGRFFASRRQGARGPLSHHSIAPGAPHPALAPPDRPRRPSPFIPPDRPRRPPSAFRAMQDRFHKPPAARRLRPGTGLEYASSGARRRRRVPTAAAAAAGGRRPAVRLGLWARPEVEVDAAPALLFEALGL